MKNNVFKVLLTLTLLLSFAIHSNVYAEQTSQQTKTEVSVMLKRPIAGTPQQIVEGNPSINHGFLPKTSEQSNHTIFLLGIFIFVLCCLVGLYKKTEKREES